MCQNMASDMSRKMMNTFLILTLGLLVFISPVHLAVFQGKLQFKLDNEIPIKGVPVSLYKGSDIIVKIDHGADESCDSVTIGWLLRETPCAEEYSAVIKASYDLNSYYNSPEYSPYTPVEKFSYQNYSGDYSCDGTHIVLQDSYNKTPIHTVEVHPPKKQEEAIKETNSSPDGEKSSSDTVKDTGGTPAETEQKPSRRKREDSTESANTNKTATTSSPPAEVNKPNRITKTWQDGIYLFIIKVSDPGEMSYEVTVEMVGPSGGYLPALEWPLLPFYGTLCVVYLIFGLAWLIMSAMYWKDLLRVQFWIGGVIFLGMVEKAVYFSYYESYNGTGASQSGVLVLAELISCLKRSLARMLVIIVSLGFGIVKPRLGPMLHRVVGVGALFFLLSAIEGCMRVRKEKTDNSKQIFLASIPLAVLDAVICWWIFTSLIQTIRTLRVRRNIVKLSLYRHFTNTLIFAVLASVAYMVWSMWKHRFTTCVTDWKELWVDEAFWPLLFSSILLVIIILWRPSANNQRYAFSVLTDGEAGPESEPMLNDAFEGITLRSKSREGSPKEKTTAEDDMKWIEENIPKTVVDIALPSVLDSDEEIETSKYEISKMQ